MDFSIDAATAHRLATFDRLGREQMRPLGLEADRLGRPTPPDHPYFQTLIDMGFGRTRWRPSRGERERSADTGDKVGNSRATLLLSEQLSYWDRGDRARGGARYRHPRPVAPAPPSAEAAPLGPCSFSAVPTSTGRERAWRTPSPRRPASRR